MVLSRPPWSVFLIISVTPPNECKQLRGAGGHKPQMPILEQVGEGRKNTGWTTFNFNFLKGIALEILVIRKVN